MGVPGAVVSQLVPKLKEPVPPPPPPGGRQGGACPSESGHDCQYLLSPSHATEANSEQLVGAWLHTRELLIGSHHEPPARESPAGRTLKDRQAGFATFPIFSFFRIFLFYSDFL